MSRADIIRAMLTAALLVVAQAAVAAQVPALAREHVPVLSPAQTASVPAQAPVEDAPYPDQPLTHIFQNLGSDLRRFPELDTLVILGAGGMAATVAHNSDDQVNRWTIDHPVGSWTSIGRVGGDGWTMGGLAIGTWAVGEWTAHPLIAHVGSDLIRAQMVNAVLTTGTKVVAARRRPSGGPHAFPSGHTSAAFASAGVLQTHFGWKGGVPAFAASSFIALTRVRDRKHWVSDVVFGAAVGLASARAVTRGHGARSWSITPVAVPGGAGVVVTRISVGGR